MSFWHGDFSERFDKGDPRAIEEYKKSVGRDFEKEPMTRYDGFHMIIMKLCFIVTDEDSEYLRRLRESRIEGAFSYYNHFYWIMLTVAFRGLRETRPEHYICEVCGKEITSPQVHHWSYDNCGKEFAHLEDLGLLCGPCHLKQHHKF